MPPTTDNIPEKPPFDVYAMMLILSTLITFGACALTWDDLTKNWNYWYEKTDKNITDRATHITQISDDPSKDVCLKLQKIDLDEWKRIKGANTPFPIKDFEWPAGYDPAKSPVRGDTDNLQIPDTERGALLQGAGKSDSSTPPPATTPPARDAPQIGPAEDRTWKHAERTQTFATWP